MELEMLGLGSTTAGVNGLGTASGTASGQVQGLSGAMAFGAIQAQLIMQAVYGAKEAVRAFTDYLIESTLAAVDAGESWNKFTVVFGDSADDVNERLEGLSTRTNNSIYGLRDLSAGIQDMLVPMGIAREQAAGLSVDFTTLAIDMASFNNASVDDTLNAITSALAGQSRPLRQYGVDTRVAALESHALAMGIHGSWEELDQATQAQVLYSKIVADTADAQGDAARTADEAQGTLRGLRVMWEDGAVTVGEYFIPVIEELVPLLKEELADALPILQQIAERIANDMLKYGPTAIEVLGEIVDVAGFLVNIFGDVSTVATSLGGVFAGPLGMTLGMIVDLLVQAGLELTTIKRIVEGLASGGFSELYRVLGLTNDEMETLVSTSTFFSDSLGVIGTKLNQFNEYTNIASVNVNDLSSEVEQLTQYTKELERAQVAEALAGIEQQRVFLMGKANIEGYTDAIKTQLLELDKLQQQIKTALETPPTRPDEPSTGGTSPTSEAPDMFKDNTGLRGKMFEIDSQGYIKQQAVENQQRLARIEAEALAEQTIIDNKLKLHLEAEEELLEARRGLFMEFSQDIVGGFVDEWGTGFEDLDEMFANMIKKWTQELITSGILTALSSIVGGGPVGMFGSFLGGGKSGGMSGGLKFG